MAQSHIGEAMSLAYLCVEQARFQGLKQYSLQRTLFNGTFVEATLIAGSLVINITSRVVTPADREDNFIELPFVINNPKVKFCFEPNRVVSIFPWSTYGVTGGYEYGFYSLNPYANTVYLIVYDELCSEIEVFSNAAFTGDTTPLLGSKEIFTGSFYGNIYGTKIGGGLRRISTLFRYPYFLTSDFNESSYSEIQYKHVAQNNLWTFAVRDDGNVDIFRSDYQPEINYLEPGYFPSQSSSQDHRLVAPYDYSENYTGQPIDDVIHCDANNYNAAFVKSNGTVFMLNYAGFRMQRYEFSGIDYTPDTLITEHVHTSTIGERFTGEYFIKPGWFNDNKRFQRDFWKYFLPIDLSHFTDIKNVVVAEYFVLGLKNDGTVVIGVPSVSPYLIGESTGYGTHATFNPIEHQSTISQWSNIKQIAANSSMVFAVTNDGVLLSSIRMMFTYTNQSLRFDNGLYAMINHVNSIGVDHIAVSNSNLAIVTVDSRIFVSGGTNTIRNAQRE
ncbi:hypothetical protein [Chrysiogenes arsenatis]|uniref:hypothetical protein n=1 Tax=Chrysiogenes arsenatis TaxID=309797 RepID=UPI0012679168|nr:hypothetical protein [Chrysiogenes arsenatis]